MSHELEILEDGSASMAYTGQVPWHSLGVHVPPDLTPVQILEAAKLNWTVSKVPLIGEHNGKKIKTKAEALVRDTDNRVLTIVTDSWNPCQNLEAFEFFNDFVAAGEMSMETAGSLFDGQHVWALAKTNEKFELFGGDVVENYLLFSNPHTFGKSIDIRMTSTRVVCNNTISLALNQKASKIVKVSHRRVFDADAVKETLGVASDKLAKYKEISEHLGAKRFNNENIVEYFNRVFPKTSDLKDEEGRAQPNSRAAKLAMAAIDHQPGAEYAAGSWWAAYNAVTYLTNHVLGRNNNSRMNSVWFGQNQVRNLKALNLAAEYADAA